MVNGFLERHEEGWLANNSNNNSSRREEKGGGEGGGGGEGRRSWVVCSIPVS